MASFVDAPTISVSPRGSEFEFTVEYTMRYTDEDRLFALGFAESMALWEKDDGEVFGGDDDLLFNIEIRTFRPARTVNTRQFVFTATADELGTESGGEEIYAVVHHRRNIDGVTSDTAASRSIPLAV